ncbi:MAG: anthranilate synthase component I family protein [Planctomycetota bacterium]
MPPPGVEHPNPTTPPTQIHQPDPVAQLLAATRPTALLHSARHHPRWARHSLIATPQSAWVFTADSRSTWLGPHRPAVRFTHDPFDDLDALLAAEPDTRWIGYLSYDLGRHVESIPNRARNDRRWPLAVLHRCPDARSIPTPPDHRAQSTPTTTHSLHLGPVVSAFSPADYQRAVAHIVDRLHAGDAFEVNLTTRLTAAFTGRPADLFAALLRRAPAWYAAHIPLPDLGDARTRALASISPELFLDLTPDGSVTTRPIKGSRPADQPDHRHPHAALDATEKDRAELAMVVDMLRNDLGRVCRFGSVQVPDPRSIERHPTIDHGVATVTGTLRPDATPGQLLRATLPGGSITGAPKVQAMRTIEALEPVRRGPYCGAIGTLQGRSMTLAIAIRTACIETDAPPHDPRALGTGRVDFHVGSGIVADSLPRAEWRETLHKAKPFRDLARTYRNLQRQRRSSGSGAPP